MHVSMPTRVCECLCVRVCSERVNAMPLRQSAMPKMVCGNYKVGCSAAIVVCGENKFCTVVCDGLRRQFASVCGGLPQYAAVYRSLLRSAAVTVICDGLRQSAAV